MPNRTHQRLAKTAARLIKTHGREVNLVTKVNSGSDRKPEQTNSLQPVTVVFTRYKDTEVDGQIIQIHDRKAIMDSSVTPTTAMRILDDDGVDYSIVDVAEIKPAITKILYIIQFRR